MPLYGKIVVIKRDGSDGTHFPLTANSCLFGRKRECDIRIQLPQVSKEHCKIEVNENKEVILFNLSSVTPTQVNGNNITDPAYLKHGDILTIIDRSFRFEYPPVSLPQRRRSRSQEKDTLQVLHVQQDSCSQDSKDRSPQIPDKELEQRNQTPNGNKKERTQELVTAQDDASESAYKIYPSERKNEISGSSEFSVSVKHEDATNNTEGNNTEGNSELFSQDNSPRKDGNMPEGISQIANKTSAANLTTTDVMQKDVSHAGNTTKNQDVSSVVPSPDINSSRKLSARRSSATRSSTGLQATKQEEGSEDAKSFTFQYVKDNEPEKSPKIKSACKDTVFRASRSGTKVVPEPCYILSLDYTDETRNTQKSNQTLRPSTLETKPNLMDCFGSDGSILSAPMLNKRYSQVYSSPFTGNNRKSFSKGSILPVELDSLSEMNYAGTSVEIEECSLNTNTADNEINDVTGNKYSKMRRRSKTMASEIQTEKEQKNEMSVNYTTKNGNSGTVASSLYCNNSKSPRRSFKQNDTSMNRNTMMNTPTEELVGITAASEVCRIPPGQLSDDNFGRNCPEEHAEKIKEPISDAHEQIVKVKNNMPMFSNLNESNVQTPVQAVSEINTSSPCRSRTEPEMKQSPRKRKNTELDMFQPLGKRKRVSFGGQLSPELFDKRLPPNSPLKKGATPARLSLPFGNSPRAVLKKTSGLRQSIIKGLSGREQGKNTLIEKAGSPSGRKSPSITSALTRRSPATSSSPRRSPGATAALPHRSPGVAAALPRKSLASPRRSPGAAAASPRRSPPSATASPRRSPGVAKVSARKSPGVSKALACKSPPSAAASPHRSMPAASPHKSPASLMLPAALPRRSRAISPPDCLACCTPQRKGRFSISSVTCPSLGEQTSVAIQMDESKEITEPKTWAPTEQESKASGSIRRSKSFASRKNSLRRRSGPASAIQSKRRSGASEANLIVAKSWADVVKQGISKSQLKTTATKCGHKRSSTKKPTKLSKNNVSTLKTPVRKFTGHLTTGHANSPAPIVVGKAHISTANLAAQVPKVMYNCPLKQHSDLNESFTGMAEMFSTPPSREQEDSLSSSEKMKMPTQEAVLEIHAEAEAEEGPTPSCEGSKQQQNSKEDTILSFIQKESPVSTLGQDDMMMTPRGEYRAFRETVRKDSIVVTANHTAVIGMQGEAQEQKSETIKVLSGTKRLLRTPKQNPEPVEALSGVKRLLRTPKQKPEPVEALSGVKRLLRTPKQNPEPVEALSGVKRLLRTPKQKPEPVEALSAVKRLLRTPKQKPEPVEALSAVKRLLRTPKQKPEPVEALSGVKRLLRTPKQKMEQVADGIVCSNLMNSAEEVSEELIGNGNKRKGEQRMQTDIDYNFEPEKRVSPMEDFEGIQRLFKTPKEKNKPLEDLVGISQLFKTPRQTFLPVDDQLELQKCMTEPKQNYLSPEIDSSGIKEMLETRDEHKDELPEFLNLTEEENGSYINSRKSNYSMENESESKEAKLEVSTFSVQKNDHKHDIKLEDTIGCVIANSSNELKTEAGRETIEIKCETSKVEQTQSYHPEEINFQNGAKSDFVEELIADLGSVDKEVVEVLVSSRRTRKGKANEYSFMKEHTRQVQRYTRNSCRAKSANVEDRTYQNTNLSLVQESESSVSAAETVKRSSRGTSRKHFTEKVESVMFDDISHAPEVLGPSKEASVKIQPYHKRRMAAKEKEAEETCDLKANANIPENGCPLDSKITLKSKEDVKNDVKSAFVEVNIQDKMQNKDLENSGMENIGNRIKRGRRAKKTQIQTKPETLNATIKEDKTGSKRCIVSKSYKKTLENSTGEVKDNAVKQGKGRKVHFQLEKNDVLPLQEKSTLGVKGGSPQKEKIALLESIKSSTTEHTSQRRKRKTCTASQPVFFPPKKQALEISDDKYKQDKNLSSENVLAKGDKSGVGFSLGQEECGQEGQNGASPDETQKVQLESIQAAPEQSCPSRHKVVKENNVPRRGRSKQAMCKEIPTQNDSKQAAGMKDEVGKENQPRRGKGRKIVPQLEICFPVEHSTLEGEDQKTDNLDSAQGEHSEQQMQNDPDPNETQKMILESAPVNAQQKEKENPLRRSKRKVLSHEIITENVSQQEGGLVDQNMDIINKNLPKRTKGRKIVSKFQIPAKEDLEIGNLSSAPEECPLQQPQHAVKPNETQKVPMESVHVPAKHSPPEGLNINEDNLPRRGRRKAIVQKNPTEHKSEQAGATKDQGVVDENACSAKESQSKRSRARKTVPASQSLTSPLQNNSQLQPSTQSKSAVEQPSEASETKTSGNLSHRSRRRKTDEIITAGSVSASKKPRLLDKSNKEKMPRDIQDVSKEKISKRRGRKQLVLHKTLAECNGQLGNDSEKAVPVRDESIPLEKGSGKENKSKKNKGKQIALASEVPSPLNVSFAQPPLSSEKGGTASENQSTVTENGAVGKARRAKRGSRNKTVAPTTAVRRKYKQTEEEVDHEKNSEKTTVTNQKQCRSNRKKLVALETTICTSLKEKYGLKEGSDTSSKDLLQILDTTAAKKNPPRRGRRQVNSDSETSATTSDTRDVLENKLKSKAENSKSTTLQKGKRKKMKEEPTRVAAGTAEETEGRTRGSKRTKK